MKYSLIIGWLYPELMSTYGDRGNILVLQKRCEWRDISLTVMPITKETTFTQLRTIDILFGGGAQDLEQEIVMEDLRDKGPIIRGLIEGGKPALFVCGSPQLMGKYYEPAEGKRIEGLGIFDMVSKHPGKNVPRCIGNIAAEVHLENVSSKVIIGFENHGGRTYLGEHAKPFAKVIKGNGNNGEDRTEGVLYKNAIGCYFHGPLLPKNPQIADWIISRALREKYHEDVVLSLLDDTLEKTAQKTIARKLGIRV
jgi:CobQ-like glutamine amidotransferase family enzyme